MLKDQQMTRYFQYMRPRYSNPTYASSNVGATFGFLSTNYEKPILKISQTNHKSNQPPPQNANIKKEQSQGSSQSPVKAHRKSMNMVNKAKSLISRYGTNSLERLPRLINERDIYEKQEKKYNIITIQPKEHKETIKKYPIYRLENQDQNYFRKLELQDQYSKLHQGNQNPEMKH